jgi:hypothetical protein
MGKHSGDACGDVTTNKKLDPSPERVATDKLEPAGVGDDMCVDLAARELKH